MELCQNLRRFPNKLQMGLGFLHSDTNSNSQSYKFINTVLLFYLPHHPQKAKTKEGCEYNAKYGYRLNAQVLLAILSNAM